MRELHAVLLSLYSGSPGPRSILYRECEKSSSRSGRSRVKPVSVTSRLTMYSVCVHTAVSFGSGTRSGALWHSRLSIDSGLSSRLVTVSAQGELATRELLLRTVYRVYRASRCARGRSASGRLGFGAFGTALGEKIASAAREATV